MSPGPAARWIAPSTPPPPANRLLAALTTASTVIVVMSPATSLTRAPSQRASRSVASWPASSMPRVWGRHRHPRKPPSAWPGDPGDWRRSTLGPGMTGRCVDGLVRVRAEFRHASVVLRRVAYERGAHRDGSVRPEGRLLDRQSRHETVPRRRSRTSGVLRGPNWARPDVA